MKSLFAVLLLLAEINCHAQTEPVLFNPGLITNGGEFGLTISPDSKTALWVNSNGKRDSLRIMESRKVNGKWTKPVIASFSDPTGKWKDIDPMFSPDGRLLLFQSDRLKLTDTSRTDFDIYAVQVLPGGWGEAYNMGNEINTAQSESYASMTSSGHIYFMKENSNRIGKSDIYKSAFENGKYQQPVNIGLPVNTHGRESNPFISPDEQYLVYFSNDSLGFGEVDLYISTRKDGKWNTPVNLGKPINSEAAEFCPFYHETEKKLYFSRQVKQTGRMKEDLFWVDFDLHRYAK